MGKLLKLLMYVWEKKRKEKEELERLLQISGLKLVKNKNASIILSCLAIKTLDDAKHSLIDESGYVHFNNLTKSQANKKMADISNDANRLGLKFEDHVKNLSNIIKSRKNAFIKWKNKFDYTFFNHLDGELGFLTKRKIFNLKYLREEEWVYLILQGQGGHRLNKAIEVKNIIYPNGISKVADLPDNIPFIAKISIKSSKGKKVAKAVDSTMFPKNWSLERIQEEIALVYNNTIAKGLNKIPGGPNDLFFKYEGLSTAGFKIRLEIDAAGNIMNSYPVI